MFKAENRILIKQPGMCCAFCKIQKPTKQIQLMSKFLLKKFECNPKLNREKKFYAILLSCQKPEAENRTLA